MKRMAVGAAAALRVGIFGVVVVAAGGGGLEALELSSHRAAYSLSLDGTGTQADVVSVGGGLAIEWRADCAGWHSNQRITYTAVTGAGPGFATDVSFSSWESRDGRRMRFSQRAFQGDRLVSEDQGEASLASADAGGEARYHGGKRRMPLPGGTVFPTTHIERLITAARAGHRLMSALVFDGSGEDALNAVTAVIGAPRVVAEPGGGAVERWPVSLAYHDLDGADAEPQFEVSFELAADGVLRRLILDYGAFALRAEMQKLERLEGPRCHG